jgi:hypothetical protein
MFLTVRYVKFFDCSYARDADCLAYLPAFQNRLIRVTDYHNVMLNISVIYFADVLMLFRRRCRLFFSLLISRHNISGIKIIDFRFLCVLNSYFCSFLPSLRLAFSYYT